MTEQTTNTVLMIRPVFFRSNEETTLDNYFQDLYVSGDPEQIHQQGLSEFDGFHENLRAAGIDVIVIDDTEATNTPDSIFPNNWFSTHRNGVVALYPMAAQNRRRERRMDIFDELRERGFRISDTIDYSDYEHQGKYLEGTGSLVLDRENRYAYAAISQRTHEEVLERFCSDFEFTPIAFHTGRDHNGQLKPVYHTNVLMSVCEKFVVLCSEALSCEDGKSQVLAAIEKSGKQLVDISIDQLNKFAGNLLELNNSTGQSVLVLSDQALSSLDENQKELLSSLTDRVVSAPLETIERCGGGSARCMIAQIFLPRG